MSSGHRWARCAHSAPGAKDVSCRRRMPREVPRRRRQKRSSSSLAYPTPSWPRAGGHGAPLFWKLLRPSRPMPRARSKIENVQIGAGCRASERQWLVPTQSGSSSIGKASAQRGSHRRAVDDRCKAPPLARLRWAAGFGVTVSDPWAFFSALMPESDDVKIKPLYTVVHEVPHAGKVETTNVLVSGVFNRCANAGPLNQSFERSLEVFANGAWRSGSVFAPPCGCAVDLPLCVRLDAYEERQAQPYLLR